MKYRIIIGVILGSVITSWLLYEYSYTPNFQKAWFNNSCQQAVDNAPDKLSVKKCNLVRFNTDDSMLLKLDYLDGHSVMVSVKKNNSSVNFNN